MSLQKLSLTLVLLVVILALMPVAAQEDNPRAVVESFYTWYLDYAGYDEDADVFRNPIVDGSYRERAELKPALIEAIDAQEERFADPFLCAQDLPHAAEYEVIDSQHVLVNLYFGYSPHPHTLVVGLQDGLIANVDCMETATARGTAWNFYYHVIEDRDSLEIGSSPLLTDALNAQLSEALKRPLPLREGDPVVCAHDHPQYASVHLISRDGDRAKMLVREFFANDPNPHLITLDMVKGENWQIDTINCAIMPEDIAAYLYNEFVAFRKYDIERDLDQTPLMDWNPYPWANFMREELYDELVTIYSSDAPRPVDPFLCAQDTPERVLAEAILGPQSDSVAVQIKGMFSSGPDSFDTVELATATMTTDENGIWQIAEITCTR